MAYDSEVYLANKEKILEYQRVYREKYPEKHKARLRKYKQQNAEKFAEYERKRRAAKRGESHKFYSTQLVIDTYGTICYLCNTEIDMKANRRTGRAGWEFGLQIDHVVPLSHSGSDTIENVRPTHGLCNSRKNKYVLG